MTRRGIILFLAALLVVGVAGTTRTQAKETAIVGWMFPLSGAYGAYAQEMKNGVELAVKQFNAKGGVMGKPIKVEYGDSMLKADVALRLAKEYLDSGIHIIGGNLSGGISLIVNQWAQKNHVLYMSTCYNSIGQGPDRTHYGFTSGARSYMTGAALADYAFKHLGKRWMAITADYRWGYDELGAFVYRSKQVGGKCVGSVFTPIGTSDFSAYIPIIMAKKPDFILLSLFGTDLVDAIKQFQEVGLTQRVKLLLPKTGLPIMKELGPAYDKNIYGAATWYWTMDKKYPRAKKFVEEYTKAYGGPPDADAEAGYVGAWTLFRAMQLAKTTTNVPKIISELEKMKWNLNKGPEWYRACDHVRYQSAVVLQGLGSKAKGWNMARVVAEAPPQEILQSCANDAKDIPYGPIRAHLPGK